MDKKIEKGKVIVADEMINYAEGICACQCRQPNALCIR